MGARPDDKVQGEGAGRDEKVQGMEARQDKKVQAGTNPIVTLKTKSEDTKNNNIHAENIITKRIKDAKVNHKAESKDESPVTIKGGNRIKDDRIKSGDRIKDGDRIKGDRDKELHGITKIKTEKGQDAVLKAMGAELDNVKETVTNFGNLHQAGYGADEVTEDGKDLYGKNDNVNKTVTKHGDFGEESEGGKDLHSRTKTKTEKGQDNVLKAMGAERDNVDKTATNFGNLHQAGYGADEETEDGKDLYGKNEIKTEEG